MSLTFDELETEVMKLPPELRAELLTKPQQSLAEAHESGAVRDEDTMERSKHYSTASCNTEWQPGDSPIRSDSK
jgi:hypothetical protein